MNDKGNFDEEFYGGMYNLLKLIDKLLFKARDQELTREEIKQFCPHISEDAISNNLTRLVKVGAIERITTRDPSNHNCKLVKYKIKEEFINEIRRTLYS